MPSTCVSDAFICCWTGYNWGDCKFGVASKHDCLCCVEECCLAVGEESLGVGMITNEDNKEYCKVGLGCCALGLKTPDACFNGVSYMCCMTSAASFPFQKETVESCTCAFCFLSCAPEFGCCVESKETVALALPLKDYTYKIKGEAMSR